MSGSTHPQSLIFLFPDTVFETTELLRCFLINSQRQVGRIEKCSTWKIKGWQVNG